MSEQVKVSTGRQPAEFPKGLEYRKEANEKVMKILEAIAKEQGFELLPKEERLSRMSKIYEALLKEFGLNKDLVDVAIQPENRFIHDAAKIGLGETPGSIVLGYTHYADEKIPGPVQKIRTGIRELANKGQENTDDASFNSMMSTLAHEILHAREQASMTPERAKAYKFTNPRHFQTQPTMPNEPEDFLDAKESYQQTATDFVAEELEDRLWRLESQKRKDGVDLIELLDGVKR